MQSCAFRDADHDGAASGERYEAPQKVADLRYIALHRKFSEPKRLHSE